jgi:hypothetical protein
MSKSAVFSKINGVVSGRLIETLMWLKGRKCNLFLEILTGLLPSLLTLVSLIDDVLSDRHFAVTEEASQLLVED